MPGEKPGTGLSNAKQTLENVTVGMEVTKARLKEENEKVASLPESKPKGSTGICDPILLWERKLCKKVSEPVVHFGATLNKLYDRLVATMVYYGGIGIAAPQIGVFQRVAIVDFEGTRLVMVNPEVMEAKGESTQWEGCLSLPGATLTGRTQPNRARVTRCSQLELLYYDLERNRKEQKITGYLAHAVMHELDHLQGIYYVDRCGELGRMIVMRNFEKFKKRLESE